MEHHMEPAEKENNTKDEGKEKERDQRRPIGPMEERDRTFHSRTGHRAKVCDEISP